MDNECFRWADHRLPSGKSFGQVGGCRHRVAESMSRADFGRLPLVRCAKPGCNAALGRVCPECKRVY